MRRSRMFVALVALVAALGTLNAPAGATETEPTPPFDYVDQADKLSQPVYTETIKDVVNLPMADGETIYMEITRPDPDEYPELPPLPVILEASPYHGTIATRIGDRIFPDPRQGNQNLGLTGFFGPRGYVVAMMDLRGTGRSTGCLDHLGPKDASDMKLVIEWLATRPYSNGRVGMTGHSYVGSTPSLAASVRPKGLVTIVPSAGLASMYDHQYQKGVPYNLQWVGPMVAYEGLALVRDLPPGFNEPVLTGAPTGDNWDGTPNPQTGCGMQNSSLTAGSGQVTGQYELWHAQRDWRAEAADVDIPVFMVHGVNDNAARIPAAEWFFANRHMRSGDKVWLGQWDHGSTNGRCGSPSNARVSHPNCRFNQWVYALNAWFDHHLMQRTWVDEDGNEHPIDTGPPAEIFLNGEQTLDPGIVRDSEKWGTRVYTADGWKAPAQRLELFADASDSSLKTTEPAANGSATLGPTADAVAARLNSGSISFDSAPVTEDTLFVGIPKLTLNASFTNSQVAHLTAILYRKDPGGDLEPMNYCAINPLLRFGVGDVAPVVPGQEMALQTQCFTMAHWVPAGYSMTLTISTNAASRHWASFGSDAQITIYTGPGKTRALLPQVPEFTLFDDVPLRKTPA
ncbi:MAG TPA: CocE/NonD family hydrolase [Actinomycetota bacterium]